MSHEHTMATEDENSPVTLKMFNERLEADKKEREKLFQWLEAEIKERETARAEREAERKERETARAEREVEKRKRDEDDASMRREWSAGHFWNCFLILSSLHKGLFFMYFPCFVECLLIHIHAVKVE